MKLNPFQRVSLVILALACLGATVLMTLEVFNPRPAPAPAPGSFPENTPGSLHETNARIPAPEPMWDAPDFELIDQDNQAVTRDDLLGRVWVADFFFTDCKIVCPMMSTRFKALQEELVAQGGPADDVVLVSFSIDPQVDRPERLKQYAQAFEARPGRWWFLTSADGTRDAIWTLIGRAGFKLTVHDTPDDPFNKISHSPKFVLVDRQGRVRGYYNSDDPEAMARLRQDLQAVWGGLEPQAPASPSDRRGGGRE